METALLFWLSVLFLSSDHAADPIQQAWLGRSHTRDLSCERVSQAEAHRRFPATVPATAMRSTTFMDVDALVCARRLVPVGERDARDDVIVSQLGTEVAAIVGAVAGVVDPADMGEGGGRVFVDAWYPSPPVAQKIAIATRQALAQGGHRVSNLAPLLAAGDVEVLQSLSIAEALPVTCARLFAEQTLTGRDVFVGVALLRDNETQLHAGLCQKGRWQWLR
jgi:hypothetical protein